MSEWQPIETCPYSKLAAKDVLVYGPHMGVCLVTTWRVEYLKAADRHETNYCYDHEAGVFYFSFSAGPESYESKIDWFMQLDSATAHTTEGEKNVAQG